MQYVCIQGESTLGFVKHIGPFKLNKCQDWRELDISRSHPTSKTLNNTKRKKNKLQMYKTNIILTVNTK